MTSALCLVFFPCAHPARPYCNPQGMAHPSGSDPRLRLVSCCTVGQGCRWARTKCILCSPQAGHCNGCHTARDKGLCKPGTHLTPVPSVLFCLFLVWVCFVPYDNVLTSKYGYLYLYITVVRWGCYLSYILQCKMRMLPHLHITV